VAVQAATPTQCREFADQCGWLAREAKMERHRQVLKEMAEAWRKLAEEVDRTGRANPRS